MPFDLDETLQAALDSPARRYAENVNPRFAKALGLIGFDRTYVRAQGPYLWDANGHRYLDMLAGYGVFNIGRNHPVVKKALTDFMARDIASLVQMELSPLVALAAERLKARVGLGLDLVYFGSTGAEANETAIKFARRTTGRSRILHATSAFHGLTTGALALNGSAVFREGFGPLTESAAVPFGDIAALESELKKGDVAAFFVEPIQGKGVHIAPPGYLPAAARLCHAHGALLVVDEVQTGVARTGRFLALHHEPEMQSDPEARPDMVLMSKALSGGFVPVSAVLMTRRVYDAVFSSLDRAVVHSSTFGKSAFAAVALLATLAVVEDKDLAARAERLGRRIMEGLKAMQPDFEFMHAVRGRGLMIAVDFGPPASLKLKAAWKTVHALNPDLFCQAITMPLLADHGILTQVAGHNMTTIKLIPPLVIGEEDVEYFLTAFRQVMEGLHRFPGPAWESLLRIGRNAGRLARTGTGR